MINTININLLNNLVARKISFNTKFIIALDLKIKNQKKKLYKLQHKHNLISNFIKSLKKKNLSFTLLIYETLTLKQHIAWHKNYLIYLEKKLKFFLLSIPNTLDKSVPIGQTSCDNIELRLYEKLTNNKNKLYALKDIELNKNYIDFDLSAKISGTGFVILKNSLASLHRALGNYMVDLHIYKHSYNEIYSPLIVNDNTMFNSGHFPKFYDDQFNIANTNLWLIPTAEVVLANFVSNSTISLNDLPIKLVSKTPCFRKEKGSYGYKVKGLIRQHQFDKVELVKIVPPENSYDELESLVNNAEVVLQNLNLSYRVICLCTNDTGFTSAKTYDLEVWFPKRNAYIEISSCSNTEIFQSQRMNAKIKRSKQIEWPHILNGSGVAIGRLLLAIIENYTTENGDIIIPDVLIKYMNGQNIIKI